MIVKKVSKIQTTLKHDHVTTLETNTMKGDNLNRLLTKKDDHMIIM